MLSQHKNFKQL